MYTRVLHVVDVGAKIPLGDLILTASSIPRMRQRGCRGAKWNLSRCCRWSFDNSIKIRRAEKQSFRHAKPSLPVSLSPSSPFSASLPPSLVSPSNLDCMRGSKVSRSKVAARWWNESKRAFGERAGGEQGMLAEFPCMIPLWSVLLRSFPRIKPE